MSFDPLRGHARNSVVLLYSRLCAQSRCIAVVHRIILESCFKEVLLLLASERSERDTLRSVQSRIAIYMYIYI